MSDFFRGFIVSMTSPADPPDRVSAPPPSASSTPLDEPLLGDVAKIAELLGVAAETVRRWRKAGKLPQPYAGGKGATHLWILQEIRAWVAAGMPACEEWDARKKLDQQQQDWDARKRTHGNHRQLMRAGSAEPP